jgi:hypothetical protein
MEKELVWVVLKRFEEFSTRSKNSLSTRAFAKKRTQTMLM